jgi:hypothetical protein
VSCGAPSGQYRVPPVAGRRQCRLNSESIKAAAPATVQTMRVEDAREDDEVIDGWILTSRGIPITPHVTAVYED